MAFEFKLPDIGEGLTEGEVVKWLVKEGDRVTADQPMVEVMTDKATVEITAPKAGVIAKIHAAEGQTIPVGSVMVVIDESGGGGGAAAPAKEAPAKDEAPPATAKAEAPKAAPAAKPAAKAPAATPPPGRASEPAHAPETEEGGEGEGEAEAEPAREEAREERRTPAPAPAAGGAAQAVAERREHTLAAPATRRLARELGLDLGTVPGTGPNGRVTRADVESYAKAPRRPAGGPAVAPSRAATPAAPSRGGTAAAPAGPSVLPPLATSVAPFSRAEDEHVPVRGMRARIAEQMVRSKQFAPHFMLAEEIDVTELVRLRESAKASAEERGVKLTYLPFVMKALVACFRRLPILNAVVDDAKHEYVIRHEYNVGIATDTPDGLTVPVVKHVDRLSVLQIAAEIQRLTAAAREKKIALEDLKGGTFTITSAGSIGGTLATPILNYPEVSILGVYRIVERPVVRDGQVVIRSMMNVSSTHDHRIVDGATAARFLNELKRLLETPALMLLEG